MKTALYLSLLFNLAGCTTIYFKVPQPDGVQSLKSFPESFEGTYIMDSDTVYIGDTFYTYPENYRNSFHISMLDSMPDTKIVGDRLFDKGIPIKEGIPFIIKNDTLKYDINITLTTHLSDTLIAKPIKKYLVMSQRDEDEPYWVVFLLQQKRNGNIDLLLVGDFQSDPDKKKRKKDGMLSKFHKITSFQQLNDSDFLISPSAREFQVLVKKGFFGKSEELVKLK